MITKKHFLLMNGKWRITLIFKHNHSGARSEDRFVNINSRVHLCSVILDIHEFSD